MTTDRDNATPPPKFSATDIQQRSFDFPESAHIAIVHRYLHLTRAVMPALARTNQPDWPVRNDHCFQRIVLDTICGGVWYDHIARPAHRHLSAEQARSAVDLCEAIIAGTAPLDVLNRQSLAWRAAHRRR